MRPIREIVIEILQRLASEGNEEAKEILKELGESNESEKSES